MSRLSRMRPGSRPTRPGPPPGAPGAVAPGPPGRRDSGTPAAWVRASADSAREVRHRDESWVAAAAAAAAADTGGRAASSRLGPEPRPARAGPVPGRPRPGRHCDIQ